MSSHPPAVVLRLYRWLAAAYPQEFQNVYGEELLEVSEQAIESIRRRDGLPGLLRLLLDIAIRVPIEYVAEIRQDVRYGWRALAGSPGFTAVALISLSLGIAIATCALSEMNGMALRSIPAVQNPGELVALQSPILIPVYRRFRDAPDLRFDHGLRRAGAVRGFTRRQTRNGIWGHLVSALLTLRRWESTPALGAFFGPDRKHPAEGPPSSSVIVSGATARPSDPLVVGKTIRVDGRPCTVVGVAPEDFLGASPLIYPADLWMLASAGTGIAPELADNALESRDLAMFFVVGRLKPGMATPAAEAELDAVADNSNVRTAAPNRRGKAAA